MELKLRKIRKIEQFLLVNQNILKDILKKYGIENYRPISTLIDMNKKLSKVIYSKIPEEIKEIKDIPYQSAIKNLIYLIFRTKLDIIFAVGILNKYNSDYGKEYW